MMANLEQLSGQDPKLFGKHAESMHLLVAAPEDACETDNLQSLIRQRFYPASLIQLVSTNCFFKKLHEF